MFCEVIVDIKHEGVNRVFDYEVPDQLIPFLERGMRVIVPFGHTKRLGFVMEIKPESDMATRQIEAILDIAPTIGPVTFKMLDALESHVIAPKAAMIDTVIPDEQMMRYERRLRLIKPEMVDEHIKALFNRNNILHLKDGHHQRRSEIKALITSGAIMLETVVKTKAKAKTQATYQLNLNHSHRLNPRQQDAVDAMDVTKTYDANQMAAFGLSPSMIQTLVKHDVLMVSKEIIIREPQHVFDLKAKQVTLTKAQQKVFEKLIQGNHDQPYLLKGISGSGKTELYIHWIHETLKSGKTALVLVPEIALIGMMAQRLKSIFDEDVVIYHSALSSGERHDAILRLMQKDARILLGTRSAVFVPMDDVGLIIIDEEHDDAYIQKEGIYYDAREMADIIAKHYHAKLILGSATPSLVSMYRAKQSQYHLLELNERPFATPLPSIHYIDMKQELQSGNTSMFSKALMDGIKDRLNQKEQVLILHNRKGYAPFVLCRSCGDVPKCPHCEISLTYYHDRNELRCHYCGHHQPYQTLCNVCGMETSKPLGAGTEMVEKALKKAIPEAKILRMDADVTTKKGSHEAIWHAFSKHEADVLIGTQMIAKGLDFKDVTLVGVLMADQMLKIPSYFASEKAYMLLAQMCGRSGRMMQGETIIQGYNNEHYAIQSIKDTYDAFYQRAIQDRMLAQYEPFVHVGQLLFEGESYLNTYQAAFAFKKQMNAHVKTILGPAPALIKKIKDRYRFTVTIKYDVIDLNQIKTWIDTYRSPQLEITYRPSAED